MPPPPPSPPGRGVAGPPGPPVPCFFLPICRLPSMPLWLHPTEACRRVEVKAFMPEFLGRVGASAHGELALRAGHPGTALAGDYDST